MKPLLKLIDEIIALELPKEYPFDIAHFNEKLAEIQKVLGVESGDNAGFYFASCELEKKWLNDNENDRKLIIRNYIHFELMMNTE